MESKAPSMMMPALIAGGSLGFLSGLPISSCACCLWAAAAGVLAAFLYSRSCSAAGAPFDAGKGGVLGLLTGAVFGVVGAMIGSAITLLTGGLDADAMREAIESNPMIGDPAEAEQAVRIIESAGPLLIVLAITLIWLVLGVIFAAVGGLIGGSVFRVEAASTVDVRVVEDTTNRPAPPASTDEDGPPPPPVAPGI